MIRYSPSLSLMGLALANSRSASQRIYPWTPHSAAKTWPHKTSAQHLRVSVLTYLSQDMVAEEKKFEGLLNTLKSKQNYRIIEDFFVCLFVLTSWCFVCLCFGFGLFFFSWCLIWLKENKEHVPLSSICSKCNSVRPFS